MGSAEDDRDGSEGGAGYDTDRVMVDVSRACVEKDIRRLPDKGNPEDFRAICVTELHILIIWAVVAMISSLYCFLSEW